MATVINSRSGTMYLKGAGRIKRWWLRKRHSVTWNVKLDRGILRMSLIDVQWSRPSGLLARLADRLLPPDTITAATLEVDGHDVYEWHVDRQPEEDDCIAVVDTLTFE